MQNDFKLIGYYVDTEYNNYSKDTFVIFNKNKKKVIKEIKQKLLNKKNSDKYYYYNITEIYEIHNPNYYKFGFYNNLEEYGETIIIGTNNYYILNSKTESFKLKTPKHKIPKSEILLQKIHNLSLINCNGLIEIDNINKQIELLKQLKK